MKKGISLALAALMLGMWIAGVAAQPAPNAMKDNFEMRKNIAWTVEGLYQLGKSTDRILKLTPQQAKKILPLYQELIAKKIIQLKLENGKGPEPGPPTGGPPPRGKEGTPPQQPDEARQQQHEKRMRERAALVAFGNAKMEAINRILSKQQVAFIDNWDFQAEKYGFPNFHNNHSGGNFHNGQGHFGGPPSENRHFGASNLHRPKRGARWVMDPQMEAGRKLLIKLNQAVLKMLQNYK